MIKISAILLMAATLFGCDRSNIEIYFDRDLFIQCAAAAGKMHGADDSALLVCQGAATKYVETQSQECAK